MRSVDIEQPFKHPSACTGGVIRREATDQWCGYRPQHQVYFGTESGATGQNQRGHPVRIQGQQLQRNRPAQ